MNTTISSPESRIQTTPRKRGRQPAFHRMPDGTKIEGLKRQKDGRWRISATNEFFTEPNELRAVAHFEAVMAKLKGESTVELPLAAANLDQALKAAQQAGGSTLHMRLKPNFEPTEYSVKVGGAEFYAAVAKMLIDDPKDLSRKTGVEWVARGAELPKPLPSPTLKSIGDVYAAKPGLSANEASRSRLFWKEFCDAVEVTTVAQLTHERVAAYEAKIRNGKLSPKSILHRFRKVRSILHYAIKRGKGIEDCRKALDMTAMLEVPDHSPLDPKPITKEQFGAVYQAALDAGDKTFAAMLLLSLNCAMYAGEAAACKWEEVDLKAATLVTRRPKTGVSRIACLWPETVAALKKLSRRGEFLFYTTVRSYTTFSGLDSWRKYRNATILAESEKPAELKFSSIRDASFSIALTVSLEQARLLAGHKLSGSADFYVRRNPQMVTEACEEIRKAFAPFKQMKKVRSSIGRTEKP